MARPFASPRLGWGAWVATPRVRRTSGLYRACARPPDASAYRRDVTGLRCPTGPSHRRTASGQSPRTPAQKSVGEQADDPQNLAGRRLLLERLAEISNCAPAARSTVARSRRRSPPGRRRSGAARSPRREGTGLYARHRDDPARSSPRTSASRSPSASRAPARPREKSALPTRPSPRRRDRARADGPIERRRPPGARRRRPHAPAWPGRCPARPPARRQAARAPIVPPHPCSPRAEEPQGAVRDRLEHRLRVRLRLADGAQDVRGGRLPLQRLAEVLVAPLQLGQEPRVLDGDDRLVGERLE